MYSHTRACSIRSKVESFTGQSDASTTVTVPSGPYPEGLVNLLRTMAVHDDRLERVVREHRPHLFAEQLLQLANAYNSFYRDCHVIVESEVNAFYFALSEAARVMLKQGMEGLGIVPLESM